METQNKRVGGFFELELPQKGSVYHDSALAMANGRTCFKILMELTRPTKVFLPFYCCNTLVVTLERQHIPFAFYALNSDFEPLEIPDLLPSELFVYINYFGLKSDASLALSQQLDGQLVLDNTQAFFEKSYGLTWSFNSTRKFFGVPDGGFLYSPQYIDEKYEPNEPIITDHLWLSFNGKYEEAFRQYQQNETLQTHERNGMSELTKRILFGVDFPNVARSRKRHFRMLDHAFRPINKIPHSLLDAVPPAVPFCYPLLLEQPIDRNALYENKIYVPTFWAEMLTRNTEGYDFEKSLVNNLLILPIDHRLAEVDLKRMVEVVSSLVEVK